MNFIVCITKSADFRYGWVRNQFPVSVIHSLLDRASPFGSLTSHYKKTAAVLYYFQQKCQGLCSLALIAQARVTCPCLNQSLQSGYKTH